MVTFADRVKGVVFGTAYGDAMGAVVEKMTFNEIHEKYGRVETTMTKWWKADWSEDKRLGRMRGEGIVTDDTLMTLALMNVYGIERRHLMLTIWLMSLSKRSLSVRNTFPSWGKSLWSWTACFIQRSISSTVMCLPIASPAKVVMAIWLTVVQPCISRLLAL